MSAVSPGAVQPVQASATVPDPRVTKIHQTAQHFEAIFIRQMLAAARKSSFGDTMTSSQAADSFVEQQDAHFADIAAQKGSFGLGHMIEKQLLHQQKLDTAPAGSPAKVTGR